MADRIKGITIEIGGDTSSLSKALKGVDSQLKTTQSTLKDVNKLLKLDPKNTELLTQKQKYLKDAISQTESRLKELTNAQSGVAKGSAEWDSLQRKIIETQNNLKGLKAEYNDFGSVAAQKIKAVGKDLQDFGGKLSDVGNRFAPVSAASGALFGSLVKLGHNAITSADDLNTLSKQSGISTTALQKIKYASDLVDVSLEDVTGALRKMKSNMDPANESFKKLNVSVTNSDGSFRDATDVFDDTIVALSQIKNETERDKMAMEIFGKSADQLAGIIDDGGAAFRAYGQEAEDMGLILSQDTLDALNKTNDTVDKLKAQMGGALGQLGATLAQTFAPALEKVAGFISKLTEKIKNLTPEQTAMIAKIAGVVAAIAPLLIVGGKLVSTIGSIASALNPTTLIIAAVVAAGILLYKNWDTIKATAVSVKDTVVGAWNTLKTSVVNTWNTIKSSVTGAAESIRYGVVNAWNGVKNGIGGVIDGIRAKIDGFKAKFDELKTKVSSIASQIKSAFSFDFRLPKLKLPHIRVTYRAAESLVAKFLGISRIPQLTVEWYKKAYDNAMMFSSPTVLATPSGLKGFGDGNGAEIVLGLHKLRELVGSSTGDVTINVYAAEGMDINALADKIQDRFVAMKNQRRAAYA